MTEDKSREELAEETDDEEVEGDVPETIDDDDLMTVKFLKADGTSLVEMHLSFGEYGTEAVLGIFAEIVGADEGAVQIMNMMGFSFAGKDANTTTLTVKGFSAAGESLLIRASDVDRIEASLEDY